MNEDVRENIDPFEPKYRAVGKGQDRYGIRLENSFWHTLSKIAEMKNLSLYELIASTKQKYTRQKNLSSHLRVICQEWTREHLSLLEDEISREKLNSLANACPAPTLIMYIKSEEYCFNESLIGYLQTQFSSPDRQSVLNNIHITFPDGHPRKKLQTQDEQIIRNEVTFQYKDKQLALGSNITKLPCLEDDTIIVYPIIN